MDMIVQILMGGEVVSLSSFFSEKKGEVVPVSSDLWKLRKITIFTALPDANPMQQF